MSGFIRLLALWRKSKWQHKVTSSQEERWMELKWGMRRGKSSHTWHFIFFPILQRLLFGIQKENLIKGKRVGILALWRPAFCIWHWNTLVYDTKKLLKALKERKTNGKDLESWHHERHWVLLGWGRRTRMENCKATFVHNKWWDSSGTTADSCSVSSELTAAASAGLSLPPAPLTSSLAELTVKAVQCGSEAFARRRGLWMLLEREGKMPGRSNLDTMKVTENAQSHHVRGYRPGSEGSSSHMSL